MQNNKHDMDAWIITCAQLVHVYPHEEGQILQAVATTIEQSPINGDQ